MGWGGVQKSGSGGAPVPAEGGQASMERKSTARELPHRDATNQPLSLIVVEAGEDLLLDLTADSRRFEAGTPIRLLEQFRRLLEGFTTDPERKVGELSLTTPAEWQQVVCGWNQTQTDYPRHLGLHHLFEATV